jgi:hypothetical protein
MYAYWYVFSTGHIYNPKCYGCALSTTGLPPRRYLNIPQVRVVPTAGGTITLANNSATILEPASSVISGQTINLPLFPVDGDVVRIVSADSITSVVIQAYPNSGATVINTPTVLTNGQICDFTYNFGQNKWYGQIQLAGGGGGGGSGTVTGIGTYNSGTINANGATTNGPGTLILLQGANLSGGAYYPGLVDSTRQSWRGTKLLRDSIIMALNTGIIFLTGATDARVGLYNQTNSRLSATYSGSGAEYGAFSTNAPVGVPHF